MRHLCTLTLKTFKNEATLFFLSPLKCTFSMMIKKISGSSTLPIMPSCSGWVIWYATMVIVRSVCSILFSSCLIISADGLWICRMKTKPNKHSMTFFTCYFLFPEHRDFQVIESNSIMYSDILTFWLENSILYLVGGGKEQIKVQRFPW